MKTCSVQGQAAGTASAYAAINNITPVELVLDHDAIWSVQQQLLRDDCFIIGLSNEDSRDHARTAKVSASSEQDIGKAEYVINGQTRAVYGKKGDVASFVIMLLFLNELFVKRLNLKRLKAVVGFSFFLCIAELSSCCRGCEGQMHCRYQQMDKRTQLPLQHRIKMGQTNNSSSNTTHI